MKVNLKRLKKDAAPADGELLQCLSEAESLIGTPTTTMFMDEVNPSHRLNWLRKVRALLTKNGIKPENLSGEWHT